MSFIPSEYNIKIFDFIENGKGNCVVSAVAGSGKTTTLLESLKRIPTEMSVIFLAFNKSIADELRRRIPENVNVDVKTVHSFGCTSLMDHDPDIKIDNFKYRKILKDVIDYISTNQKKIINGYKFNKESITSINEMKRILKDKEYEDFNEYLTDVVNLCNLGRLHFIDMKDKRKGFKQINNIGEKHSINTYNDENKIAWHLIKLGMDISSIIDYTDMIFLPNVFNISTKKYDFVFIDECQDLNTCQRLLMLTAIKPDTGRFIAVGDPKQAIYAFAGADHESYEKLLNLPNTIQLPLSLTYRCKDKIVESVRHINSNIFALPTNKGGEVLEECSYNDVKDGDMVLCRMTLPVVSLCFKYLSQGKKAFIIGSDIGLSLINMVRNCKRENEEYKMSNVFARLMAEREKMIEKVMEKFKLKKDDAEQYPHVLTFTEKVQALEVLSKNIEDPNIVMNTIKQIFSDEKGSGICLSTIHKSKGLESDRVFILHPELMPSKYAKLDWEITQETNLRYVAYTRAKTTLGFITDYDAFKEYNSNKKNNKDNVTLSRWVGSVGSKIWLELKVITKKDINGQYGKTVVYEMSDKQGNIFSKFGEITPNYLKSPFETSVEINSKVNFYGVVKEHAEFRGTKITKLGKISLH